MVWDPYALAKDSISRLSKNFCKSLCFHLTFYAIYENLICLEGLGRIWCENYSNSIRTCPVIYCLLCNCISHSFSLTGNNLVSGNMPVSGSEQVHEDLALGTGRWSGNLFPMNKLNCDLRIEWDLWCSLLRQKGVINIDFGQAWWERALWKCPKKI
jgi:hypothetical protein